MKLLLLLAFAAVGQCALLGSKKCTYGPSYWCGHIHNAKECSAFQYCMKSVWGSQKMAVTSPAATCTDVVKILDDVRQASEMDLLTHMAKSCTEMPREEHSKCKELMTHDQDEILLLLQSELSSKDIAAVLGLCEEDPVSEKQPLQKLKPYDEVDEDYCTDCLSFFSDVVEIVNNTQGEVDQFLKNKVCSWCGPLTDLCNKTVDLYTEWFYTFAIQQLNPEDWCFLLHMCNATETDLQSRINHILNKVQVNGMECDVCHNLVGDLQSALKDTAVQNEILKAVENGLCSMLPGDSAIQCKSYVSQYGPLVLEIMITKLDPQTACQTLGFCSAGKESKLTAVPLGAPLSNVRVLAPEHKNQIKSMPLCALCEFVMEKLESLLPVNRTEKEITAALEKVCSLLPASLSTDCNAFVDKYGPEVVKLLMDMAPEGVCVALGLCVLDKPVTTELHVPVKDGSKCAICETIVGYVRSILQNKDGEKTVEKLLDVVCKILPQDYRAMCKEVVSIYTPSLIDALNKYDDPVQVCRELKMCNSTQMDNKSNQDSQPLKFLPMAELQPAMPLSLCSQGPTVWCANMENAKLCNAVEHCAKYYKLKPDA